MIAISEFMKSQGYAPSHAEHTRIPGIWKKLSTLYNLPALDERVSYDGAECTVCLICGSRITDVMRRGYYRKIR